MENLEQPHVDKIVDTNATGAEVGVSETATCSTADTQCVLCEWQGDLDECPWRDDWGGKETKSVCPKCGGNVFSISKPYNPFRNGGNMSCQKTNGWLTRPIC